MRWQGLGIFWDLELQVWIWSCDYVWLQVLFHQHSSHTSHTQNIGFHSWHHYLPTTLWLPPPCKATITQKNGQYVQKCAKTMLLGPNVMLWKERTTRGPKHKREHEGHKGYKIWETAGCTRYTCLFLYFFFILTNIPMLPAACTHLPSTGHEIHAHPDMYFMFCSLLSPSDM